MNQKELIELVDEVYHSAMARDKIITKCESKEFEFWNSITKGQKLLGKFFSNDTTGQNLGFTYFQVLSEEYTTIKIQDLFYVQKSDIGDFVTFYVKSNVVRESEGDRIIYNRNLICEPIGKFKPYFDAHWNYLNQFYAKLVYVLFYLLDTIPENSPSYKLKSNTNLYELLFGYEGNILRSNIIGNKLYRPKNT